MEAGGKVAAEIERLNERMLELNTANSRGEITLKSLSVESQPVEIQRHLTLCLALAAAPRDEVSPLVVVLVNSREIMKVFPAGELPEDPLKPNSVYEKEQGANGASAISRRTAGETASASPCSPASRNSF